MKICLPAITTAGLFTAIVILDLINREYKLIFGHTLFGFISILLVLYLCEKSADYVAWILLVTPFVLIFLGWTIGALRSASGKPQPVASTGIQLEQPAMYGYTSACISCVQYPCICSEATVEKPVKKDKKEEKPLTDLSGNQIISGKEDKTCGPTGKSQCLNVKGLPSV